MRLDGGEATVALGRGHASSTTVVVKVRGASVRFAFPGLPSNVVFDGTVKKRRALGERPSGAAARHLSGLLAAAHACSSSSVSIAQGNGSTVSVVQATGFPAWLVELPEGQTHGIGPTLTVGERLGDTSGNGSIAQDATGISWKGVHYTRVALRQREVRVGDDAATLTIPPNRSVSCRGDGPRLRAANARGVSVVLPTTCLSIGVAVLADDKRGVGQSGGIYPGERATDSTIDVLARDAQAEVRFLAKLPQIDPQRLGLFGDSQAGWIIPLAAAREHAVRWALPSGRPDGHGVRDRSLGLARRQEPVAAERHR